MALLAGLIVGALSGYYDWLSTTELIVPGGVGIALVTASALRSQRLLARQAEADEASLRARARV